MKKKEQKQFGSRKELAKRFAITKNIFEWYLMQKVPTIKQDAFAPLDRVIKIIKKPTEHSG